MKSLRLACVLVALLQFVTLSYTLHYPFEFFDSYLFQENPLIQGTNDIPSALRRSNFNILASLLDRTGLTGNLSTTGPFTLFAPTDDAFEELRAKAPIWFDTLSTNIPLAQSILSGHVLRGFLPSWDIPKIYQVTSLSGEHIYFQPIDYGQRMAVNGSRILGQRRAENGIIYAIDKMMVEDIFEMLALMRGTTNQALTNITRLLIESGVSKMIDFPGKGLFTLLAPNDDAFRALPDGYLQSLLDYPDKLKALVLNHMFYGSLFVSPRNGVREGSLKTVGGGRLRFVQTNGAMTVGGARIIVPNRPGNNGVNHVIDRVLLPEFS